MTRSEGASPIFTCVIALLAGGGVVVLEPIPPPQATATANDINAAADKNAPLYRVTAETFDIGSSLANRETLLPGA